MKLYPRLTVNIIGVLFVLLFLRLSYWQWERHGEKRDFIATLEARLREPPAPLTELTNRASESWQEHLHRRVTVSGVSDYDQEMVLRNRRLKGHAGVHVVTPLKVEGTERAILVVRGFAPLEFAPAPKRAALVRPQNASFTGLIKESVPPKFLAPRDLSAGGQNPWRDEWLRVDVAHMQKQIPYPLLPVFLEIIPAELTELTDEALIRTHSGKDELFLPSENMYNLVKPQDTLRPTDYPVPVFDLVLPPGRHLGYVFEWGVMALLTIIICLIIQLRPPRVQRS